MGTPIAALEGRFAVGSTILDWEKFDIDCAADDIPVRTFESIVVLNGVSKAFERRLAGFHVATVNAGGFWDAAANANIHSNPPNIQAGNFLTNVYGYVRKTGTRRFVFPSFLVLNVKVEADSTGANKVMCSLSGKSSGYWTYPS